MDSETPVVFLFNVFQVFDKKFNEVLFHLNYEQSKVKCNGIFLW